MPRVFIIEDDHAVGDSLTMFLSAHGRPAVAYPDAETFLREATPSDEDTLLVDLGLPGMSGREMIEQVRGRGIRPSIIIVSGQRQAQLDRQLAGLEYQALLRKPLDPADIEHAFA